MVWEVWQILYKDYGGKESIDPRQLSEGAIQGMVDALGEGGSAYLAQGDYDLDAPDLGAVWEAWRILSRNLEGAEVAVTNEQLQEAAVRGMLDALGNPYTIYLQPQDYELEVRNLSSTFEGIGVYVNLLNNRLTVILPIPDTPAERAGLVAGDVILEVDGTSLEGLTVAEAATRIRGPRGTPVDLLILHADREAAETITVVRDVVKQQTVHWESIGEGLAYLRISQFLDETDEDVKEALREITDQGFNGLIIDVRRNPGGLVATTISVASQFLEDGVVFYQIDGRDKRKDHEVLKGGIATEIPLVVLTDLGSASASEIVAGALQDYERAIVIGTRTFGKGSVNEIRKLRDGSGLYLASALWYTPDGRLIEGEGLAPDILLPMDLRIPLLSAFDWQLFAAVEYLESRIPVPVG